MDDQARQTNDSSLPIVTSMQRFAHHGLHQAYTPRSTKLKSYHCLSYHLLQTHQTSWKRSVEVLELPNMKTVPLLEEGIQQTSLVRKNNISRRGCGKIVLVHCLENW